MLVYQNKTAKDVFYGDSKIKEIYLGNKLIFAPQGFMNFLQFDDNCVLCVDRTLYTYACNDVNSSAIIVVGGTKADNLVGNSDRKEYDYIYSGAVTTMSISDGIIQRWVGDMDKLLAARTFMQASDIYIGRINHTETFSHPEIVLSGATFVNTTRYGGVTSAIVQTNSKVYEVYYSFGVRELTGIDPGLDWGVFIHVPADVDSYYRCFLASRSGTLVLYRSSDTSFYEHWRSSDGVDYSKMQLSFMPESYSTSICGLLNGKVIKIKLNEDFSCTVSTLLNNCTRLEAPYAICNGKVQFFSTEIEYTPIYPPDPDAYYIDVVKDGYTFIYRTADGRFFHVGLPDSGGVFELRLL